MPNRNLKIYFSANYQADCAAYPCTILCQNLLGALYLASEDTEPANNANQIAAMLSEIASAARDKSSSVWAALIKHISYALGAKYTPLSRQPQKNFL